MKHNTMLEWKQSTFAGPHTPVYYVSSPISAELDKPLLRIELNIFAPSPKEAWQIDILGIRTVKRSGWINDFRDVQMYAELQLRVAIRDITITLNPKKHEQNRKQDRQELSQANLFHER